MKSVIFLLFCGLSLFPSKINHSNISVDSGDSRIIFFAGDKCGNDCYKSKRFSKQCIWFQLGYEGMSISNLNQYTSSYTEEYDCHMINIRHDGSRQCKYRTVTVNWENQINRVYMSDPKMVVIFYDQPNFQGNSLRVWGQGCYDLKRNGWANKAESIEVFYQ